MAMQPNYRMNVLQVCLGYPPNYHMGGAALTAAAVSEELARLNHLVLVAAPKLRGASYQRARFRTETEHTPIATVTHCGTWVQVGFKTINPAAVLLIPTFLRRADMVIIHGLRIFLGTVAALSCWLLRKPYIIFPHGMAQPRWRSILLKRVYDALVGRRILRRAAAVACLSEREREEVLACSDCRPERVRIVTTSGAIASRTKGPTDWERARILFLCRVRPEKSIEMMIEAIADPALLPHFEITVAGPLEDPVYAAALRRKAEARGVALRFAGLVSGDEKADLLSESHLLALISESESWGRVVAEALELGTPVLVSDTCGIASQLDDSSGVVVPRTVEALRDALRSLCAGDFARLRALRGTCRKTLRPHGADNIGDLLEAVRRPTARVVSNRGSVIT